jgi:hypothetical protein
VVGDEFAAVASISILRVTDPEVTARAISNHWPDLIAQIDRYAKERKSSRSEALRELFMRGLGDKS